MITNQKLQVLPANTSPFWDSPALEKLSDKYPERFEGRIPLKIRVNRRIAPDHPFIPLKPGTVLMPEKEYFAWTNSFGAVAGICDNGEKLGVKPDEFEVVEWFQGIGGGASA